MILTCHLLAGAAVASKAANPMLALPLALLSHYFLDSLPQEEYTIENIKNRRWNKTFGDFLKVFIDISFGVLLISLFSSKDPLVFAGAFLAIVPDGITLLSKIFTKNKLFIWHQKIHQVLNDFFSPGKNKKIPVFWGIFMQTAVVFIAIFLLQ